MRIKWLYICEALRTVPGTEWALCMYLLQWELTMKLTKAGKSWGRGRDFPEGHITGLNWPEKQSSETEGGGEEKWHTFLTGVSGKSWSLARGEEELVWGKVTNSIGTWVWGAHSRWRDVAGIRKESRARGRGLGGFRLEVRKARAWMKSPKDWMRSE